MMPMPNSDAIGASNLSHQFSLMPENPLRSPGHRRFLSELPPFSNDVCSKNNIFIDDFDDEAFAKFFDDEAFAEISESMPQLPLKKPALGSYELGASSTPSSAFKASDGVLGAGSCTQQMQNSMHQCSQSKDTVNDVSRVATSYANRTLILKSRKKQYSPIELAEISLVDPRRAKRILTQRKPNAKAKERNEIYKAELEYRFQYLQSRIASIHMQLDMVKHDVSNLTAENKLLHLRLQAIEQHLHLQEILHDMPNGEIKPLNLMTNGASSNAGMG